MKTDEKVAVGVVATVLTVLTGGLIWWVWPLGDGDEKDAIDAKKKTIYKAKRAEKKKAKEAAVFVPGAKRCSGVAYNAAQHPDPASVVKSLRKLDYALKSLASAKGQKDIKAFQRRARELGLRGMAGKSDAWIDGLVGPCTLLSLEDALVLEAAGDWTP